jgi:hypothetical protein
MSNQHNTQKEITCYNCNNTKPTYWLYDGYGIPLVKVCDNCKESQLKRFRKDINTRYEADEEIQSDW